MTSQTSSSSPMRAAQASPEWAPFALLLGACRDDEGVRRVHHCRFGLTILRFRFVASVCVVAEAASQSLTREADR